MTVQRWDTPDKVEAQKLRFGPGDVIFGRRRAYQKKVALAEFEGICSAHALVLRARPGYIDPSFLPILLSSNYFLDRAIEISVGSLSPTVNWRDLKTQEFDLPPLDEQGRIAELIWAVERHSRATVDTRTSTQVLFRQLLTELCVPGDSESTTVGEVCDILDNKRVPLSAKVRATRQGTVPYYGAGGPIDHVDEALFDEPLVLLCEDGFGLAAWNERPIAYRIDGPAWVNNHAHVLRAREVSTEWLRYTLMHYDLTPYLSTTVKPKLTLATARNLRVRKSADEPHLVSTLQRIENSRDALDGELQALHSLRSALLAGVFGGE